MIIELDKMTISDLLKRSVKKFNQNKSIASVEEEFLTYSQMEHKVTDIVVDLCSHGIRRGDRVAILGENSPNWVVAYLAVTTMGCVAVPILPGFPDSDSRHILRQTEAVALFVGEKQQSKLNGAQNTKLKVVYSLEDLSRAKDLSPSFLEKSLNFIPRDTSKVNKDSILEKIEGPKEEDLATIIYTSGTTGHSKGVMLTHRNIVFDVVHSIERFPINKNDRFLSILPLSHTFEATGGMLCPLAVGASISYMQGLPTPQKLLSAMQSVKPTAVLMVPLVIDKIYRKRILPQLTKSSILGFVYEHTPFRRFLNKAAGKKLIQSLGGQLRFFMFGGASLNEDVESFLRDAGISYSSGYGMTETSPIMTINPFEKVKIGSCGKCIPGIQMKTDQGDTGTVGEILVKGPIVTRGYYKNPVATRETFTRDSWLKTGDLGYFDEEGYLFIKGRSKNVIVGPSGENIYPEIIEQHLLQSPYIQEVIVYERNDRLVAQAYLDYDVIDEQFVSEMKNKDSQTFITELLDKIRRDMNQQLSDFSHLHKIIEHPEPFEKTPTNKVKRYLYIEETSV
ncbi:AMP-binding protein [candidate division KSB1 bacterium]|nr:AMP-binding protein [candidate division KSB1 bacterium]